MLQKVISVSVVFLMLPIITGCVSTENESRIIGGKSRTVCGWEKHYVLRKPEDCARAKYGCVDYSEGTEIFMDSGGCGCREPVFCEE